MGADLSRPLSEEARHYWCINHAQETVSNAAPLQVQSQTNVESSLSSAVAKALDRGRTARHLGLRHLDETMHWFWGDDAQEESHAASASAQQQPIARAARAHTLLQCRIGSTAYIARFSVGGRAQEGDNSRSGNAQGRSSAVGSAAGTDVAKRPHAAHLGNSLAAPEGMARSDAASGYTEDECLANVVRATALKPGTEAGAGSASSAVQGDGAHTHTLATDGARGLLPDTSSSAPAPAPSPPSPSAEGGDDGLGSRLRRSRKKFQVANDTWDELCIGFWKQTGEQFLAGRPGECVGISVLRVKNERELDQMDAAQATGLRVIVLTENEVRNQHTTPRPNTPIPGTTTPAMPPVPTARANLREWLHDRWVDIQDYRNSIRFDETARKKMREAAKEQLDRQVEISKRVWDKLSSLEVVWRAAAFTQKAVARKAEEARHWWEKYWSSR